MIGKKASVNEVTDCYSRFDGAVKSILAVKTGSSALSEHSVLDSLRVVGVTALGRGGRSKGLEVGGGYQILSVFSKE